MERRPCSTDYNPSEGPGLALFFRWEKGWDEGFLQSKLEASPNPLFPQGEGNHDVVLSSAFRNAITPRAEFADGLLV